MQREAKITFAECAQMAPFSKNCLLTNENELQKLGFLESLSILQKIHLQIDVKMKLSKKCTNNQKSR